MDEIKTPNQQAANVAPSAPQKTDLNSLVYKTMPKGYTSPPISQIPKASPQAPRGDRAGFTGSVPVAPSPATVISRDLGQPEDNSALIPAKSSIFSGKLFWLITGGIVLLVILGLLAYFFLGKLLVSKPTSNTTITPTTNQNQNNSGSGSNQQSTAPTSKIDPKWMQQYFGVATCSSDNQGVCGDNSDPDNDGLTNLQEFQHNTNPTLADTDGDGIADGDEVNVFNTDPTTAHTGGVDKYTDAGDIKYKYSSKQKANFTDTQLVQIAANIKTFSLHKPTTQTLTQDVIDFYTTYGSASGAPKPGALDRDTQRQNTVKQIGYALLKYQQSNKNYPDTQSYDDMIVAVKPLLTGVAVNTTDPTNVPPLIYSYQSINSGQDFKIGYYSEVQNQPITYSSKDIQDYLSKDQAAQNDIRRESDLANIRQALILYSGDNANTTMDPNATIYPAQDSWKTTLVPKYLNTIPMDPQTSQDYIYTVNADNTDFALQAQLQGTYNGKNKYLCNTDGCGTY